MIRSVLMLALLATGVPAVRASTPQASAVVGPLGDFTVIAARRDRARSNPQSIYKEDDPQLVGRIVSIGRGTATFDRYTVCGRLTAVPVRSSAGRFLAQVLPRRTSPNYAVHSRPADFRLPLSATTTIAAVRYRCAPDPRNQSFWDAWTTAAALPLPGGRWGLVWGDDFVLVLAPRPRGTPSHAGFDCAKATAPVERTICTDPVLAGWDRSVATAYEAALKMSGGDADLVAEQRRWLADRAKCGTDLDCLHEAMSNRARMLAGMS